MLSGDFPGGTVAKPLAPNVGGPGLIPGQGIRSHMSQLRPTQSNKKIKINIFLKERDAFYCCTRDNLV